MSGTGLDIFDRTVQKTNLILKELADELHWTDRHHVYMALRSSLHALRDRLPPEEAAKFASQLPLLVKGIFYDGWRPGATPVKVRDPQQFLDLARREMASSRPNVNAEQMIQAVFRVLARRISEGEWEDVRRTFPEPLRELLPEPAPSGAEPE
jgi:uncharacterized protein (DUF2267 family)